MPSSQEWKKRADSTLRVTGFETQRSPRLGALKRLARRVLPPKVVATGRHHVLHRESELPIVEVLVANHCNLSCKGCNAFSPLSPPRFEDPEQFDRDIRRLADLFDRITRIGLVGGEPLLHPQVTSFMRSAREASPTSEIYLVSNGILLVRQPPEFWEAMARYRIELNVSDYPVNIDRAAIGGLAARHDVHLEFVGPREQFWNYPIRVDGGCDAARSFETCRAVVNCPMVSEGRLYSCGRVGLIGIFEKAAGCSLPLAEGDSIDIYSDIDAFEIQERLTRPLDWCRHCDVDAIQVFDWESGRRSPEEWM